MSKRNFSFIFKLPDTLNLNTLLNSSLFLWMISITASVLMWVYVTGMDESAYITRKFTCPLEYRGLDSQAVLRNRISEVDIELRGSEEAMMRLDYNAVTAFVDARNLPPGKRYTVNISVQTPSNMNLVSCTPSQLTLDLVRQVTRLMTVDTVLPQSMPAGYYIDGAEIIPREVGIRGAEDDVAKVGSVRITPTLEELQEGRELLMPVKFSQSEPFDGAVTIEPAQVRFRGLLVRGLPRKRVPVNVRLTGLLNPDYEVRSIITDPSEIQIEGSAEDLALIDSVNTENVNVSGMDSDRVIVVQLKKPENGNISFVNASGVKVSIYLSEARAERVLTNIPVEFRGSDAQKWISIPAHVNVAVEGRPSLIENFSLDNVKISAYVDMSNIFMSPVTLPVNGEILSGDGCKITRIEPANVIVNTLSQSR